MFKISRRNFIKGAGMAALAVAAAGMLTGCGSSAPEMVVHVGYYYKDFLGNAKPIQDADKYAEVVSVVKGSKVKKSDLKNLQDACNGGYTHYSAKDVPDEIDVDWETATAKVILSL